MSQIESNEIVNPTIMASKPLQPILQEQMRISTIMSTSGLDTGNFTMLDPPILQMTPRLYAAKEKRYRTVTYSLTSAPGVNIGTIPISPVFIGQFINSYTSFMYHNGNPVAHIKPTNNTFFQGEVLVCFDPAPNPLYYDMFGITLDLKKYFQFKHVVVSMTERVTKDLELDRLYPFSYFVSDPIDDRLYFQNYHMGTLLFIPTVSLATTSALTSIPLLVNFSVQNHTYGGTIV